MNTPCHIPLANSKAIYNVADVDRALEGSAPSQNEPLRSLYEKMRERGGERFLVRPSSTDGFASLHAACPNFKPVIDDIRKHTALAIAGNEAVQFMPILLLGEPGVGKTHFAKCLAQVLGTGFEFVSMSSLTAGWILSGASSQWMNAKPGKVAQSLVQGEFANPLITLDEVDKAGGDARYDPMGALYTLLEHDTALHFKDEFIEVAVNASHILWVATANDESAIPEPILNRMNVYNVERPDQDGAMRIARTLYSEILAVHNWGFAPELSDEEVLEKLADIPPRDMRKLLLDAFGNAKMDGRDYLLLKDLNLERLAKRKAKIGFYS
jgi:ATP-dependent Lon protease